jgi:alcohol dehydrogenase
MAILQGGLSASCSLDQMIFSGLDAVSHCVETLWNQNRTVLSEMFAREGLESLVRVLPKVIGAGGSVDELQTLQEAAMLAGLAISQSRTAIAHSISYPITSSYGMPHGLACSFTIPAIWAQIDQAKKTKLKHASLIQKAVELIESLDLSTKVVRWLSLSDSTALLGAMLNSNRAENFIQNTDEKTLKNILSSSF